jgi:hypothetical protein
MMKTNGPLLPEQKHVPDIKVDTELDPQVHVLSTRDHAVIQRWAAARQAEPATGEATTSGPATVDVKDGGAGVRFNFPGRGLFRPIPWEEWFENFDRHGLTFVYDNDVAGSAPSSRYRIVKTEDWKEIIG